MMGLILISLMSCSQLGHLLMSALLVAVDGCCGKPIVALGWAGTSLDAIAEVAHG